MEAPTAVTDKFPPEIYGDNLLKTLKKIFLCVSVSLCFDSWDDLNWILTPNSLTALSLYLQIASCFNITQEKQKPATGEEKLRIFIIMILLINKLWKFIWMYLFVFKHSRLSRSLFTTSRPVFGL